MRLELFLDHLFFAGFRVVKTGDPCMVAISDGLISAFGDPVHHFTTIYVLKSTGVLLYVHFITSLWTNASPTCYVGKDGFEMLIVDYNSLKRANSARKGHSLSKRPWGNSIG